MKVAVLAVQGAFLEHEQMLRRMGVEFLELRQKPDLDRPFDGLILPGGESTVMGKLLRELGLFEPLRQRIASGMPVLGTCAGLILLAKQLVGDKTVHFGTLPVTVQRNAYGRQLGSFHAVETVKGIGPFPMTFIRAPWIEAVEPGVEILARVQGRIAAVRYGHQIGVSFHPELTRHTAIHELFLSQVSSTHP